MKKKARDCRWTPGVRSAGVLLLSAMAAAPVFAADVNDPANFQVTTNATVVKAWRTNDVDGAIFAQSFPDGEAVTKLILGTAGTHPAYFIPVEASALPEGLVVTNGQWRFKRADALGKGTVTLGGAAGAQLVYDGSGVQDITNKIVFANSDSRLINTKSTDYCVCRALGVSQGAIEPWLGRADGTTRMTLALTEDANDPLRRIRLSGAFKPFALDGGTVRIAAPAKSPFFSYVGTDADRAASRFELASTNAVTVDAEAGADVELGLPLKLKGELEVSAETPFANNSFEGGATDWTFTNYNSGNGAVGVKSNGDTTWVSSGCNTPSGTKFYVLRCNQKIESNGTIALAAAPNWYVSFYAACRDGYDSQKIPITVQLKNTATSQTYEFTTAPQNAVYNFREFRLGPYDLPAGNYQITIRTVYPDTQNDPNHWSAVAVDNIQLLHRASVPDVLVKTGAGRVAFDGLAANGTVFTAREGTLALLKSAVTNATVAVENGGTFELGPELALGGDGLTVDVASGGTFALNEYMNTLVKNPRFERDQVADYRNGGISDWTYTLIKATAGNGNYSGLQRSGGTLSSKGPYSEYGDITPYIRNEYRLWQTVTVPEAGAYRFAFVHARRARSDYNWTTFHLRAYVARGGVTNRFDDIALENFYQRYSTLVNLEAGSYTIGFETYGENVENGTMAFVDDVILSRVAPLGEVTDVRVNLASGSTVLLGNVEPVHLQDVFVDGVRINGGPGALRNAGVTVTGSGVVSIGEPLGLIFLIK